MHHTTIASQGPRVNSSGPLPDSLKVTLDQFMSDLLRELQQIKSDISGSVGTSHPLTVEPATPESGVSAPVDLQTLHGLQDIQMCAAERDVSTKSLVCPADADQITVKEDLHTRAADLNPAARLFEIAELEGELKTSGLVFEPGRMGIVQQYDQTGPFPFDRMVRLAKLHAGDRSATGTITAVQLLISSLGLIPMPVNKLQWPVILDGISLLKQLSLQTLAMEREPPPGWNNKSNMLGQIQLNRTLLNPNLSPVACLQELGASENAVVLLKRQLLQQPSVWSDAQCQLAWMLLPLAPTKSADLMSGTNLNWQLYERLLQSSVDGPEPEEDALAMGARGLFELHPRTRQMHLDADTTI